MSSPRQTLVSSAYVLTCAAVLLAPWLFGAWEMWWFWPFAVCLFVSSALLCLAVLMRLRGVDAGVDDDGPARATPRDILVVTCLPFLGYALARFLQADVYMDAERSFLLFFLAFLLGLQIMFAFSRRRVRLLHGLIVLDLAMLGIYGIANHFITGSSRVLWNPGYENYWADGRASGTYYCPDHFAGIMELAACLGLGLMLDRKRHWAWRLAGVAATALGTVGVLMSKSRGGGLALLVIAAAVLVWGLAQWRPVARWAWRLVCAGLVGAIVFALLTSSNPYIESYRERFRRHRLFLRLEWGPAREMAAHLYEQGKMSSRGLMIGGALRAWRSSPVTGIGPGMHQNLWPHFASSSDGNREEGTWPRFSNYYFHSYEVHSDWVQLLEEYGILGVLLLLVPTGCVAFVLVTGIRRQSRRFPDSGQGDAGQYAIILGAWLSLVAIGFHSLGDFNLQMPATTWLLAVIVAAGVAETGNQSPITD